MVRFDKKALMGIGTLIIFIATILVAAVAAAVLISTSSVLQQRSLLVGQEARKGITNGVETVKIMSRSDYLTESFNDFEVSIRLSPGSDALQMKKFDMQFTGPHSDDSASLAYDGNETGTEIAAIDSTGTTDVYDFDEDEVVDTVELIVDAFGNIEGLQFNLSDVGGAEIISIGKDLATAGATDVRLNIEDEPIIVDNHVYGVVSIKGYTDANDEIVDAVNVTVKRYASLENCDFDVINPGNEYCFVIMSGNGDYVLGSGERVRLLYKLEESNVLGPGDDFSFIFTTDKGRLLETVARTPDVVTSTKAKLWPLG